MSERIYQLVSIGIQYCLSVYMLTNGDLKLFEKGMPTWVTMEDMFCTELSTGIQSTLSSDTREHLTSG